MGPGIQAVRKPWLSPNGEDRAAESAGLVLWCPLIYDLGSGMCCWEESPSLQGQAPHGQA
jgi:hypothetical protein